MLDFVDEVINILSSTLKILRENNGYTQQQVADALNIDRSTYTYYEIGKTTPDINTIIKLAKIFNVSYSDLLSEEARYLDAMFSDVDVSSLEFIYNDSYICNYTYELTKEEKKIIAGFRALSGESKKTIMRVLCDEVKKSSPKL